MLIRSEINTQSSTLGLTFNPSLSGVLLLFSSGLLITQTRNPRSGETTIYPRSCRIRGPAGPRSCLTYTASTRGKDTPSMFANASSVQTSGLPLGPWFWSAAPAGNQDGSQASALVVRSWPALGAETLPPSPAQISPYHLLLQEHSVNTGRFLRETVPQDLPALLFSTLISLPDGLSHPACNRVSSGLLGPAGESYCRGPGPDPNSP